MSIFEHMPGNQWAQSHEVVGERIIVLLRRKRITQGELALRLGKTQTTISRKLSGAVPWTLDELIRVSASVDIPLAELVRDADLAYRSGEERDELPRLDSNQQPSGYQSAQVIELDAYRLMVAS